MSVSPRLSSKLHETLGREAAEDLVTWMDQERLHREEMREAIRADFAEMRQEMHAGFGKLRDQLTDQTHRLETKLTDRIHAVEITLSERIQKVDTRVAETKADLMKWSFVFWVGAVGAIALLAGVLR